MYIKTLKDLRAAGREKVVAAGSARATRFVTQDDGLGFTVSDVYLAAGNQNVLWYKHHWEANYVVEGKGTVKDLTTDETWVLEPGVMYIVGPKDRHSLKADTALHIISIFNPPLKGDEIHDEDGALPPTGPLPPGPRR